MAGAVIKIGTAVMSAIALYILVPAASVFAPCLELFFETIHHIAAPARALAAKQVAEYGELFTSWKFLGLVLCVMVWHILEPRGFLKAWRVQQQRKSMVDGERREAMAAGPQSSGTPSACFQVFVKTITGKTITLAAASSDTIASLMSQISYKLEISPDQQRLTFGIQPLAPEGTLRAYNIQKDATLHLNSVLKGGNPVTANGLFFSERLLSGPFQKLREKVCESMMQIYAAREIQRDARRAEAAARKAAMHLKRLEGNAEAIAQQEENTRRLETEKAERKAAVTIREKKDKKLKKWIEKNGSRPVRINKDGIKLGNGVFLDEVCLGFAIPNSLLGDLEHFAAKRGWVKGNVLIHRCSDLKKLKGRNYGVRDAAGKLILIHMRNYLSENAKNAVLLFCNYYLERGEGGWIKGGVCGCVEFKATLQRGPHIRLSYRLVMEYMPQKSYVLPSRGAK